MKKYIIKESCEQGSAVAVMVKLCVSLARKVYRYIRSVSEALYWTSIIGGGGWVGGGGGIHHRTTATSAR